MNAQKPLPLTAERDDETVSCPICHRYVAVVWLAETKVYLVHSTSVIHVVDKTEFPEFFRDLWLT